ncbi:MAG: phenylacetic acid degradation bifunctional protein PaaZ, partial [Pseudomonadota bacterium]
MSMMLRSFAAGAWIDAGAAAVKIRSAVTGAVIAHAGGGAVDFSAMLYHARQTGGPALRDLTFHDRARILKQVALHLDAHKE